MWKILLVLHLLTIFATPSEQVGNIACENATLSVTNGKEQRWTIKSPRESRRVQAIDCTWTVEPPNDGKEYAMKWKYNILILFSNNQSGNICTYSRNLTINNERVNCLLEVLDGKSPFNVIYESDTCRNVGKLKDFKNWSKIDRFPVTISYVSNGKSLAETRRRFKMTYVFVECPSYAEEIIAPNETKPTETQTHQSLEASELSTEDTPTNFNHIILATVIPGSFVFLIGIAVAVICLMKRRTRNSQSKKNYSESCNRSSSCSWKNESSIQHQSNTATELYDNLSQISDEFSDASTSDCEQIGCNMNVRSGGRGIKSNDCEVPTASTSTVFPESLLRPRATEFASDPASTYEILDRDDQPNYHQALVTADVHVYSQLSVVDQLGYVTPGPSL